MASGDTKTEAMLNALANGGGAEQFRGCCNTKTQNYILGAIDRIEAVEDEVDELKNNPDVVDIVATYQDLEDYDTSTLTDKDIIRVLQDETQGGATTYYRWSAATNSFTLIGQGGPYYTKSQTDALLDAKQNTLTGGTGISIVNDVISCTFADGNGIRY